MKNTIKLSALLAGMLIALAACDFEAKDTTEDNNFKPSGVTTLTIDEWADGNIAANGQQWFKFTATAATQYIHFLSVTLTSVYLELHDAAGQLVDMKNVIDGTLSASVTSDSEYYIRVYPYSSGTSGSYKIAFTASETPPPSKITLPTAASALVIDKWADGNIAANGEQWFKFTATAATHWIHFLDGTLDRVYLPLYDAIGLPVDMKNVIDGTLSASVTAGNDYYIRVWPQTSTDSGTYRIAFTASVGPPETLPLTIGEWTDGNIAAKGKQWFKFTATAATHWIHFQPGTLDNSFVQLYDAAGLPVGSETVLYYARTSASQTVTVGSDYYIRVWPFSSTDSGAYRIGFTASSTAPAS
jgi:hypothetical protein